MKNPDLDPWYQRCQTFHSKRLQKKCAQDFDGVERFCLFIGYPRSGHSLVGACINAHPDAVISSELPAPLWIMRGCSRNEVYARILARAKWFNFWGNKSNYRYQIPNRWQGKYRRLKVIGDKRGGWVTRTLKETPDFLDRTKALTGVPCRYIHVVRNPFDNIAAISIANHISVEESAGIYFEHVAITEEMARICSSEELITVHHEAMIENPEGELKKLFEFLDLEPEADCIQACRKIIFPSPTNTRFKVEWPPGTRDKVETQMAEVQFLNAYKFE